jgi:hypothetical protein|tara:strand:+ start:523 stop:678 length:156 start_codon:yes stop_codon:yes gene_type:complete
MDPIIKEALYTRLMYIVLAIEENDRNGAKLKLDSLVNDVQMDCIEKNNSDY